MSAESVPIEPGKATLAEDETKTTDFVGFVSASERGLRQSLTAALGSEVGREAAAEALAYGWENWDRIEGPGLIGPRTPRSDIASDNRSPGPTRSVLFGDCEYFAMGVDICRWDPVESYTCSITLTL